MYVAKLKANKVLKKADDLFSLSWHTKIVWTLVESINNNVDRALSWEQEHLLQASRQGIFTGSLSAIVMFRMKSRKYIPAKIRLGSKLPEDRDDKVAMALLCFVTKIAIKVGQACRTRLLQRFDVFNYSGAYRNFNQLISTKGHSCRSPLQEYRSERC
jgi:hypothetical protein